MILCDAQKLLYLAPPKTGTSTVVRLLLRPPNNGRRYDPTATYHKTGWDEQFQDWFIFMTTRHPYTRAFSFWQFVCREIQIGCALDVHGKHKRFGHWLHCYHRTPPTFLEFWDIFPFKQGQITTWRASWHLEQIPRPLDCIVHQENLDRELQAIPAFCNCTLERRYNVTPPGDRPWHSHYTPELINRVHEYWGQDFAAFGYNPDFEACVRGEFFTQTSPG
jgi:hypothetical protein